MIEIERKFLVSNIEDCLRHHVKSIDIVQGYLSFDLARSIRIRKTDKKAYITIKGKSIKLVTLALNGIKKSQKMKQHNFSPYHWVKSLKKSDT